MKRSLRGCHGKAGYLTCPEPDYRILDRFCLYEPHICGRIGHFEDMRRKGLIFVNYPDYVINLGIRIRNDHHQVQGNRMKYRQIDGLYG